MKADRLQLSLIPEPLSDAQRLPPEVHEECIELVAMMLVHLVRTTPPNEVGTEVRDERR